MNALQLHVGAGFAISFVGVVYWYVRCRWLPEKHGYRIVRERVVQDGMPRTVMRKVIDL